MEGGRGTRLHALAIAVLLACLWCHTACAAQNRRNSAERSRATSQAPSRPPPGVVTWDNVRDPDLRRAFSVYESNPGEAERLCLGVLDKEDADPRANVVLAAVTHGQGRFEDALRYARAALRRFPRDVHLACIASDCLSREGEADAGRELLEDAAREYSDPTQVATCFAVFYAQVNETEEAIVSYEYALARMGCVVDNEELGDTVPPPAGFPEADPVPRPVAEVEGAVPVALVRKLRFNLGNMYKRAERLELARVTLQRVVDGDPHYASALINLSGVISELGDYHGAIRLLRRASRIVPERAGVWHNLGLNYERGRNFTAALPAFRRAVRTDPTYIDARRNLASVLRTLGRHEEGRQELRRTLALPPSTLPGAARGAALLHLASLVRRPIPPSTRHGRMTMALVARKLRALADLPTLPALGHDLVKLVAGLGNFFAPYMAVNARRSQRLYATILGRMAPHVRFLAPHLEGALPAPARGGDCRRCPRPGQPIRVGFVSMQLREHSVGKLIHGLMGQLARRSDLHVSALFLHQDRRLKTDDAISSRIRAGVDEAVDLHHNLTKAAAQLAAQDLHVLVYCDVGLDALSYFLAFGRFAPVQLQFVFGHPVTASTPGVDVAVSSLHFERIGAEAHYSERLLRLDSSTTYYPNPRVPLVRGPAYWGLPPRGRRYACLQSLFKIHSSMDPVLASILEQDPEGVILFLEDASTEWQRQLQARWRREPRLRRVMDRLVFLPRQTQPDYIQLVGNAHVALDVWPMAGGITSLEALSMGVPVVALPSRVTQACYLRAFYRALRMTEFLLAPTPEAYAARAVRVATSPVLRRILSRHILHHADKIYSDPRVPDQWARAMRRFAASSQWMDRTFAGVPTWAAA